MKNNVYSLLVGLAMVAAVHPARGQAFIVNSLGQNGVLVCSGLQTGTVAAVEWAASLSGPWQTNWAALTGVVVGASGTISVSVPMFYRVRGVVTPPAGTLLIPAGSFTMGDVADTNLSGDAAPINVYVSAFYLDQMDVTYALWQQVFNWATNHGYNFDYAGAGRAANHPVQSVDWYDCVKWCNARSEMEKRKPAYYTTAAQTTVYRTGDLDLANACVNWQAGYRLPTEAEWEKAAQGGLSGQRFPWGATISESQANYYGYPAYFSYDLGPFGFNPSFDTGSSPFTSPVGSFTANGYGLYDMAGNVSQWCWDWYGTPYAGGSDPRGPASGSDRALRGGSWGSFAISCRSGYRIYYHPSNYGNGIGFRSALPAGP